MKYEDIDDLIEDKYKKVTRNLLECLNDFIKSQFSSYMSHNTCIEIHTDFIGRHIYLCSIIGGLEIKIKITKNQLAYKFTTESGLCDLRIENLLDVEKLEIDEKWCLLRFLLLKKLVKIMKDNEKENRDL